MGRFGGSLGVVFRDLAQQKEIAEWIEGHLMADHVHMLISVPPKYSVAQCDGIHQRKERDPHRAGVCGDDGGTYVGQHFWARGYWVSTVGKNEAAVRRYIQEQEKEDRRLDQTGADRRFERLTETINRFERFTLFQASGSAGGY
jgi:putative transposase